MSMPVDSWFLMYNLTTLTIHLQQLWPISVLVSIIFQNRGLSSPEQHLVLPTLSQVHLHTPLDMIVCLDSCN